MPTGYTSDLYDGKNISFTEFALQCSRAFWACIMQRDDPSDAPLRLPTASLGYSEKALADAKDLLGEIQAMPIEVARERAEADYAAALERWHESEATRISRERAYRNMLAEVAGWTPPSPDHEGMKKFMQEQLEESIKFDCSPSRPPERQGAAEWREAQEARALRDVEYHTKAMAEEIERTNGRRAWITDLADSLGVEVVDDVVVPA